MSGHSKIARLQGSASLALEIMITNFAYGKVLIINSGYYSDRLKMISESAQKQYKYISEINSVDWTLIDEVTEIMTGLSHVIQRLVMEYYYQLIN